MKDKTNFNVDEDVSALRKAMEGLGKLMVYHHRCIFVDALLYLTDM